MYILLNYLSSFEPFSLGLKSAHSDLGVVLRTLRNLLKTSNQISSKMVKAITRK